LIEKHRNTLFAGLPSSEKSTITEKFAKGGRVAVGIPVTRNLWRALKRIAAVGNSCFDIPMFKVTGLGIAFNSWDDCTKKAADIVINEKDLSKILPYIMKYT